jgi:hypothetical protein
MKPVFFVVAATSALFLAVPASADWAPGRSGAAAGWQGSAGPGWIPDDAFPSTPPIQRFGKGHKGVRRFGRSLIREAEYRRWQQDATALRPAAVRLEDSRGRCDRLLKEALQRGDQDEIAEKTDFCRPRAYGPQLR